MSKSKKPDPQASEDKIVDILVKFLMAGGVTVGGSFAWSHLQKDELLEAVLSLVIGFAVACGFAFISPLSKLIQSWFSQAGELVKDKVESAGQSAVAKVFSMDERYFRAQAMDCAVYKTEGTGNIPGLYTLMMEDVFVPLELDQNLVAPGFYRDEILPRKIERKDDLDIWQILARAKEDKRFRQIAITAWGGFGKTTLLRHIAYTLGKNKQGDTVQRFLPVLILLRKYRDLLAAAGADDLPTHIEKYHLPNIEGEQPLNMPTGWAEKQLKKEKMLVMLDGFDEVPKWQRHSVARWLNDQIKHYPKSIFILTSRPKAYYGQDADQERAKRLKLQSEVSVLPFNKDQREIFVRKWYRSQEFYYAGQ